MSSSTQTSPPSPPQSEASTDQVTNPRWSHRWRHWRAVAIPLVLVLISALVTLWARPTTSQTPLAIDNPGTSGTMALAELLRHEGISVSKVDNASAALAASRHGATVAVVNADRLSQDERESLARSAGDIVEIGRAHV